MMFPEFKKKITELIREFEDKNKMEVKLITVEHNMVRTIGADGHDDFVALSVDFEMKG